MLGRRLTTGLLVAWTLAMGGWLVAYQGAEATCGPEIYRSCQIGLKVTPGLGRPGIVLLWSLGMVALAMTWLTSRPGSKAMRRTERLYSGLRPRAASAAPGDVRPTLGIRPMPTRLLGAAKLSLVVVSLAAAIAIVDWTRPRAPIPAAGLHVGVLSSELRTTVPASRRPEPARLTVGLQFTNQGERPITVEPLLLVPAADRTGSYITIASQAQAIPPRLTVIGTVRFKTTGAATDELLSLRRAHLRIDGQTLPLHVTVRRAPGRPRASVSDPRGQSARRRAAASPRRRAAPPRRRAAAPSAARRTQPPRRRNAVPAPSTRLTQPPRRRRAVPPAPPRRAEPPARPVPAAPPPPSMVFDDSG